MAKIFDPTRKKYIELKPEEAVRQHFVKFLQSKGYPITNIRTEQTLTVGQKKFRADIVVYYKQKPLMLVECKSPKVKLSQDTLEQIWKYNYAIGAKFLVLTNGKNILFCKIENNQCKFLHEFLTWQQITEQYCSDC